MTIWPLYGIASVAALGLASISNNSERHGRTVMALGLFSGWCAYKIMRLNHISPSYPVIDLTLCYLAFMLWIERPQRWVQYIYLTLLAQMACHVIYQLALYQDIKIGYAYRAALNALFVCQLWIVKGDGGQRGLDYLHRRFVFGRGGVLRRHGFARSKAKP